MALQKDVQTLLQKEMDRKDFLRHLGIGFAAIVGITTVIKTIGSLGGGEHKQQGAGYGMGAYGGSEVASRGAQINRG